jgi:tRNA nucleotidyltransferase (CCA-adding enzyme)
METSRATTDMTQLLQKIQSLFPPEFHNRIFLVGGSVRDSLLHLQIKDVDLLAAVPEEILKQSGFRLVCGKTTEPIWFRHDADPGNVELTRLDSVDRLNTNLLQRDFTINAMAMGLDGRLIDPFHARQDLEQRILKTCSGTVFQDDPLRIIRAFRFASDGWQMNGETEQSIRSHDWSGQLAVLPVERFSREMIKALGGCEPCRFFELLVSMDIGRHWLAELFCMPQIPAGPLQHHPEGDLLTHSLQVLERVAAVSDNPLTRFCAFFHDIGKLATDPAHYPKHHGHDEAGYQPAIALCERLALPASWGRALAWISRLHTNLNRWTELRDSTKLRIAGQAQKAGITGMLPVVSAADKPGTATPPEWHRALLVAVMNSEQLNISQDQMAALPASKRVGLIEQKRIEQFRSVL